MFVLVRRVLSISAALSFVGCNSGGTAGVPDAAGTADLGRPQWMAQGLARPACPQVSGTPTCLALIESNGSAGRHRGGWQPVDFQTRYHLDSSSGGAGTIVAIVDAYDNPHAASDLATYRAAFGLGKAPFKKFNQYGEQRDYPRPGPGWGAEIDLDAEMVSAVCPKCTIFVVEASNAIGSDLQTAEAEAVRLGAHIVTNSWTCYNALTCVKWSDFDAPGVVYVAAAGDLGYNENGAPEGLASVVSVGGTVLSKNGTTYSEQVWGDSGGGCSANGEKSGGAPKPTWQTDPDCKFRTDTDVSAVAWGVAEYDTFGYKGWFTVGGTSIAAPLVAGIYGLAGNAANRDAGRKFWNEHPQQRAKNLNEITLGSDGSCKGRYLCQAGTEQFGWYSGPAGWGTPLGTGAF